MYLLFGEEAYLKNLYKNRLKNALVDPEDTINLNLYEGKTISIPAVIDQAETMPFFAEHRLIILENSGFFKNACPELADYLPQMPAETVLLFVENEVDKRGKLFKTVSRFLLFIEVVLQNSISTNSNKSSISRSSMRNPAHILPDKREPRRQRISSRAV